MSLNVKPPELATGTFVESVVPLPSSPKPLNPQQNGFGEVGNGTSDSTNVKPPETLTAAGSDRRGQSTVGAMTTTGSWGTGSSDSRRCPRQSSFHNPRPTHDAPPTVGGGTGGPPLARAASISVTTMSAHDSTGSTRNREAGCGIGGPYATR